MAQTPISVVARVKFGEHGPLKEILSHIGQNVEKQTAVNFKATTTYFGRLVVLDNDPHYLPVLLFESQFDGSVDDYLDSLVESSTGLDAIFGRCENYPPTGVTDVDAFKKWIKSHMVSVTTYYAAYKPLTLAMAKGNLKLRQAIRAELDRLDENGRLAAMTPHEVRKIIQDFVKREDLPVGDATMPFLNIGDKLMVHTPPPPDSPVPKDRGWHQYLPLYKRMRMYSKFKLWILYKLIPFSAAVILWPWLVVLRKKEKADAAAYVPPPAVQSLGFSQQFANVENQINKNQMTHVVELKPGLFRAITLRAVLFFIDKLSKHGLTAGRLTDVSTVHFARWIYVDGGKRLLFTSNFDGPWSAYVGDFVDRTSAYLTGIWSNTVNFPATRFLIFDGAQDIDGFGWFLRINQLPTEVWYAAFRNETAVSVVSTTQIAQQMWGELDEPQLSAWLRRF